MKYIGIDLGTTNSAICSFNGEDVKLYKSPEQHDVTPSAIFIDKRGNKYVGSRAYNNAAVNPDNAATLFKRLMGTTTPIKLSAVDITMTPEECSTEILKSLFSYLPEEIRNASDTGTVITVPAAFNQMQKDATLSAAEAAGLGKVALMQEPVAAVMSVMRQRKGDGIFIIYDLGGGTLDVAIAESISGRVSVLSHGGVAMCGGRDIDRKIFDNLIKPWLKQNFEIPDNLADNPAYKTLFRMATWAAEKAKIELSQKDTATISLSETELGMKDMGGKEIYLDIPFNRAELDSIIDPIINDSIDAVRKTMEKGEIEDPINDNRYIGTFKIQGSDFEDGIIPAGAKLVCEYEILDSGNVIMGVTVPDIGGSFSAKNYYSREAGGIDYTQASKQVTEDADKLQERLSAVSQKISDPDLEKAVSKLEEAKGISTKRVTQKPPSKLWIRFWTQRTYLPKYAKRTSRPFARLT